MGKEKISVVIPFYNAINHIEHLLKDLKEQTFQDFEAIIVNNNSTDDGLNILINRIQELEIKNVRVITEYKQGPNYARFAGYKQTESEYIYFFDSDDRLDKLTLERLYSNAIRYNSDVVIGNYCEIDSDGNITKHCNGINYVTQNDNLKKDKEIFFVKLPLWNKIFKRSVLKDEFFVYTNIGEDMLISLSCIANAETVTYINEDVYYYLVSDSGLSYSVNLKNINGIVDTCEGMNLIFDSFFYHKYDEEMKYIQIQHLLYRLLRSVLLDNDEQLAARLRLIPYIKNMNIKNNIYFKKSFVFKSAYSLLVNSTKYNINKNILKFIFSNNLIQNQFKKLDK